MADGGENRVSQTGIETDGGDVVGRDKLVTNVTYSNGVGAPDAQLQALYGLLTQEMRDGARAERIAEILREFIATEANEVIGLAQKLRDGGMECQCEYASEAKEAYVKNLSRYQLYSAGQAIHGVLLNRVQSRFQGSVAPKLRSTDPSNKLELMQQLVLEPLRRALGDNPLWLQDKELDGLVFFLTGKCKITWN